MENLINFPPDKFTDFINQIKKFKYNKSDQGYDIWGQSHRGIVNHLINNYNFPYLTYRINDYCDLIKEHWDEYSNNEPFELILELANFINKDYKPNKYSHKILINYQKFILETKGWLPYSYKVPSNESLFRIRNDIFVLKVNLPYDTQENNAYINWIVFRIKKFDNKFRMDYDKNISNKWEYIMNYLKKENKEKSFSINNKKTLLVIFGVLTVGRYLFTKLR